MSYDKYRAKADRVMGRSRFLSRLRTVKRPPFSRVRKTKKKE